LLLLFETASLFPVTVGLLLLSLLLPALFALLGLTDLILALLFPTLLAFLRLTDLILALLAFLGVTLLILPSLLPTLLLLSLLFTTALSLLRCLRRLTFFAPVLSFLSPLISLGLILLTPLFASTAPTLGIGKVAGAHERHDHRRGHCEPFKKFIH